MSLAIIGFAIWVIMVMPAAAWLCYRQQSPPPSKWFGILQNTILLVTLWLLLDSAGVLPEQVGLGPTSITKLLLCAAISTGVVVGLDIIALAVLGHSNVGGRGGEYSLQGNQKPSSSGLLAQPIPQGSELIGFVPLCLVGSVWEELCFRGVALHLAWDGWLGTTVIVAASSLLFGMHHLRQGVEAMIYSSFYGVLFSVLYLATQSLPSVMIAHACGNLFVVFYVAPRLRRLLQPAPVVF